MIEDDFRYKLVKCATCGGLGETDAQCPLCKNLNPDFGCLCEGAGHYFQLCPVCRGLGELVIEKI